MFLYMVEMARWRLAKANPLRTDLVKKRKVQEETNAETYIQSSKQRKMDAWRDNISHGIDVSKKIDADFNFPMIHLMSDWVKQIHRYGALQQYSAKRHEQANNMILKDGWNASNHNLNYLPQVIIFQRHILCVEMRELNLKTLAQRREISAALFKVLPSGTDLAAPLSSQSYVKSEFMGPRNRHDGKHPDALIEDFLASLYNMQDAPDHVALYGGTWEYIEHKSRNKTYMSDEQLHAMELRIFHAITVQVESLEGERISWMCRCTGSQS